MPVLPANLRLYFVMGSQDCKGRDPVWVLREAIHGGITMFQFREKKSSLTLSQRVFLGKKLRDVCARQGIPFIGNRIRTDLAMVLDADGVHVGQEDLPAVQVRRLLGPAARAGIPAAIRKKRTRQPRPAPITSESAPCMPPVPNRMPANRSGPPVSVELPKWTTPLFPSSGSAAFIATMPKPYPGRSGRSRSHSRDCLAPALFPPSGGNGTERNSGANPYGTTGHLTEKTGSYSPSKNTSCTEMS